ncbi:hypothetical protein TCAL_16562 [Tigriopus californicus]|uniref:DNA polymerase alpha subunit B n=2 Tax=Tigriopus californicus TaxID=6832 RepID=A0A553NE35_TIGCA|nr:hypothetical protein TCAL_16562 [Tigriopus californicus]
MYGLATPTNSKRGLSSPDDAMVRNKRLTGLQGSPSTSSANVVKVETPTSVKFSSRTNRGDTLITFGHLKSSNWITDNPTLYSCSIKSEGDEVLRKPYRYMYESLRDKAGVLDEIICRLGQDILAHNDMGQEVQSFVQVCHDEIVTLGRICCDEPEGRLNPQSVKLQGNVELSGGRMVPLDLGQVREFSLFPGQIVAVQGINPSGQKLVAKRIATDAGLQMPTKSDRINANSGPLDIIVVSGPFTTKDNLDNEPLKELIKYMRTHKPHVAILHGPFLDIKHQMVENGDLDVAFHEKFNEIMLQLASETADLPTRMVIVASSREAHHHVIYPTPPYVNGLRPEDRERFQFVSDPSLVSIEGVVIGLTSSDIMFHLGREETVMPNSKDRIRRMASHLLQQRSFYPLYPPNVEMSIDFDKYEQYATLSVQPHILIVPSDLAHFFKSINDGLVMNPGRLAKGEQGGVFARLRIHPPSNDQANFIQRVQGEIVRI